MQSHGLATSPAIKNRRRVDRQVLAMANILTNVSVRESKPSF
jgi:hypothetical protein